MADEIEATTAGTEDAAEKEAPQATDWKAESRKWEKRAKESLAAKNAADKTIEELQSKVADVDELRKEIDQYKAREQRTQDAIAVSKETGVPVDLITADGIDAMREQAQAIMAFADAHKEQPAVPVFKEDGKRSKASAHTPKDDFAAWLDEI